MKSSRSSVAADLIATVTACATVPSNAPRYSRAADPPAGHVNVYVYRIGAYPTLRTPAVVIDGKTLFDPPEGSYTVPPLASGGHTFTVDWAWDTGWPDLHSPVILENEPLYIKISGSFEAVPSKGPYMHELGSYATRIDMAVAEKEMAECCRYIAPKK
jgi:hypothetical protein